MIDAPVMLNAQVLVCSCQCQNLTEGKSHGGMLLLVLWFFWKEHTFAITFFFLLLFLNVVLSYGGKSSQEYRQAHKGPGHSILQSRVPCLQALEEALENPSLFPEEMPKCLLGCGSSSRPTGCCVTSPHRGTAAS